MSWTSWLASARRAAALLAGVALLGCAGTSARDRAREQAVERVRGQAHTAHDLARAELRRSLPSDNQAEVLGRLVDLMGASNVDGLVFNQTVAPDGTLTVDVAFDEAGEAGGGLSYEQVTVRMCVRISGRSGRESQPGLADVPCGENLPSHSGEGTVTEVVRLD